MERNNGRQNSGVEDFQLNITDEAFNTLPEIEPVKSPRTSSVARKDMESSNTQAYYSDNQQKQQKKEHKKRDKLKSIKNRRVFRIVWWAMVILVALTFASYLITGSNDLFAVGRKPGKTAIEIPKNVTLEQLADVLEAGGAIKTPEFFKLYCGVTTDMKYFNSGNYTVDTNLDYEELINFLQASSSRETVKITFPEGLTLQEMAAKLEEGGVCKADEVLAAAKSDSFAEYDMIGDITNADDKVYILEGYLFPDTYQFYKDEEISSVLGKMLRNFQEKITKELMTQIKASKKSLDEVITLASIIQSEAANAEDMYKVSAVLNNRIERGAEFSVSTLGCDSTMYYPYRSKEDAPKDFNVGNKYNTYEIEGLPPGAISNPGIEAIKAAVNPNPDYADSFYFCHSADGTAYYAPTLEEHNANVVTAGLVD